MRATSIRVLFAVCAAGLLLRGRAQARSDTLVSNDQVAAQVTVRDVRPRAGGVVTGLLVNHTATPLRDVRLLIRYQWVWANERKPGSDNPGRVGYYTVYEELPPEVSVAFTSKPDPPLPKRSDGHFDISVEVVGYTEVGN